MSAEQLAFLQTKLIELLGEHTNAFLVVIEVPEDDESSSTFLTWGGGFNNALGLTQRANIKLTKEAMDREADGPDDESDAWKEV